MEENKMGIMEMKKLILTMSFPIMISMLIQALYNIVDSMFVARVSQDALAAVSLCYPIQMIIIAVACGTGVGINALLSRFLGEKHFDKANNVAIHGIILSIINWLIFVIIGLFFSRQFLTLFSQDETIISMGVSYMQICTIFSFGVFIQITYERIMQSTGNTIYNMIIQGIGAIINIILDPIFIFGYFGLPAMGVTGAAIATVIGQIIGMLVGVIITQVKIKEVDLSLKHWHIDFSLIKKIYAIAFPAILMQSIMSFMTVFMNMILASFSEIAVSVFSVYFKLQQFVFMAVLGMTNALVPIVAYNYGANKPDRIKQAIKFSLIISIIIMIIGTIVFQLFPEQLLFLFDAKSNMLEIGIHALKIISLSFVFAGISVVLCSIFQALAKAVDSLIITLLRQLILLVPLTAFMAYSYGLNYAWWAFVITEVICMILSFIFLIKINKQVIIKM